MARPFFDLAGQTFGEWTALEHVGAGTWLVRCSCGKQSRVAGSDLRSGKSTVCRGGHPKTAVVGERFGLLVVLERQSKVAICRCGCGSECRARVQGLTSGKTVCCGCTLAARKSARSKTHGMRHTSTWRIWSGMKARAKGQCSSERSRRIYSGLEVEPDWAGSFEAFLADMGERPPGTTLDRIDSTKGYVRGNCRWATWREQNQNRKGCIELEFQGARMNLMEAARRSGVSGPTIRERLKRGWSGPDLFRPVGLPKRVKTFMGLREALL